MTSELSERIASLPATPALMGVAATIEETGVNVEQDGQGLSAMKLAQK